MTFSSEMLLSHEGKEVDPPEAKEPNLIQTVLLIQNLREKIFGHLSLRDLLTCSLVSQEWRSWCRTFIHEYRKCYIQIPAPFPCASFKKLSDLLQTQMSLQVPYYPAQLIPFNGFKITFDSSQHLPECRISWRQLQRYTRFLVCYLRLKYAVVNVRNSWTDWTCCESVKLVWKLLIRNCSTLKEVDLGGMVNMFSNMFKSSWTPSTCFRNIKILRCAEITSLRSTHLEHLFRILPNLEELHTVVHCQKSLKQFPPELRQLIRLPPWMTALKNKRSKWSRRS